MVPEQTAWKLVKVKARSIKYSPLYLTKQMEIVGRRQWIHVLNECSLQLLWYVHSLNAISKCEYMKAVHER